MNNQMEFGYSILSLQIYIEKWKFKQVKFSPKIHIWNEFFCSTIIFAATFFK